MKPVQPPSIRPNFPVAITESASVRYTLSSNVANGKSSETAFSRMEKVLLSSIFVSVFVPYPILTLFSLQELTVFVFVILSPHLGSIIRRHLGLFMAMSLTVLLGQIQGISGWADRGSSFVFLKIIIYMFFVAIIVKRCTNSENKALFFKRVLLTVILLASTVYLDLYTDTLFFSNWQAQFIKWKDNTLSQNTGSYAQYLLAVENAQAGAGIVGRPWMVAPWMICGLIALFALKRSYVVDGKYFWALLFILGFASFQMAITDAFITTIAFFITYITFVSDAEISYRRFGIIFVFLLLFWIYATFESQISEMTGFDTAVADLMHTLRPETEIQAANVSSRFEMYARDYEWLLRNPLHLVFGTGWNTLLAPSRKPHNVYLGAVIGAGLVGVGAMVMFLARQYWDQLEPLEPRGWRAISAISKAGLVALAINGLNTGYFSGRLQIHTFIFFLWLILIILAAKNDTCDRTANNARPVSPYIRFQGE